jgi:tetratricopeptide (TPR) repeat protein
VLQVTPDTLPKQACYHHAFLEFGMPRIRAANLVLLLFIWISIPRLLAQVPTSGSRHEVRAHLARAQQALASKQLDSAIQEFNAVLALDPNNVEARGNLGVVQFLGGKYAEASQNLRAALTLQPSLWKVQAILGLCEKVQGKLDSARALLEKSVSHLSQDPKLQIRAGLALVEIDYQRRDLEKALGVLSMLQSTDPTDADVLYVVYRIHTDLATQARQTLALVAPDSARMHQLLAQHLINEGDASRAVTQYREALRIDPRLPGAHFELGEAILQATSFEAAHQEAQKEFEAALALNPRDAKSECRLGGIANLRADYNSALEHYLHAAELDPTDAEAQIGVGTVLMSFGQPDKALGHLLDAVRLDPSNAAVHYRLSQLYRQLGRTADAEQEYSKFKQLREAEERLGSAYTQIYKESGSFQALNPDIPK